MIPVVADADTLFAATTRGLLVYLDYQRLLKLHWTSLILDALRSAKDVHVAACARYLLHSKAYPRERYVALVTRNVRDFKVRSLQAMGIEVRRPDHFLSALCVASAPAFITAFHHFRLDLKSRPDPQAMLDALRRDGLEQTASVLSSADL